MPAPRAGRRDARALCAAILTVGVALLATTAAAAAEIAPDDPRLLERMEQVCRAQAIASDGLNEGTAALCRCAAPILARHLTPEARTSFVEQNRAPDGAVYDDQQATLDEIVTACNVK